MRKEFEDFVSVINNVIFDKSIDVKSIDLEKTYLLAKSHNMRTIFFAFVKKHFAHDSKIFAKHEREYDLLNYKHVLQCKEYAELCLELKRKNIRYIPFKGILLKDLYPSPSMREMSDVDVLADKNNLSPIKDFLIRRRYSFEHKGHHDVYTKDPGLCFEIHEALIDKQRNTGFDKYFEDPWKMTIGVESESARLSPENEFIYLLAHLYGHFHQGGTGVRSILDIYLFKQKHQLDFSYIRSVLEKNGILEFSENILKLSDVWFSDTSPTALSDELGEYVITSGSYGTIERMTLDLSNSDSSKTKNIYKTVKRKLFLNKNEIQKRYPWAKNILLFPIAYLARAFDIMTKHNKEAKHWLNEFKSMDEKKLKEHKERMRRFGANL